MNPAIAAQHVRTPALILGVWFLGGVIAVGGAFIYAELAARRPRVGGQYAYLRDAYHPLAAFLYGWALLLVIQSGGMAAVAVTFAQYFVQLAGNGLSEKAVALVVLTLLSFINCLGVRTGGALQSGLMAMKIMIISVLVLGGLWSARLLSSDISYPVLDRPLSLDLLTAVGAAMVPVLFAYGGWQTSTFVAEEIRDPQRNLPRGLLMGVAGVIVLYLGVNFVCLQHLGVEGLANTKTPASEVMRMAFGEPGLKFIAMGIAISTLGFLSQGMLTAPRVYFAMAQDGLFFRSVAWIHPRTQAPVVAILLQGILAMVITLTGKYGQILNYVVSVDFVAYGLTASCLFVFRRRATGGLTDPLGATPYRVPGHPVTTLLFVAACWLVVANTIYHSPTDCVWGLIIVLMGIPVYFYWQRGKGTG